MNNREVRIRTSKRIRRNDTVPHSWFTSGTEVAIAQSRARGPNALVNEFYCRVVAQTSSQRLAPRKIERCAHCRQSTVSPITRIISNVETSRASRFFAVPWNISRWSQGTSRDKKFHCTNLREALPIFPIVEILRWPIILWTFFKGSVELNTPIRSQCNLAQCNCVTILFHLCCFGYSFFNCVQEN